MAFLKNTWYVAAWEDEFSATGYVARTIAGVPLLIVRNSNNGYSALRDECPHRFAPLSLGKIDGSQITCGYHGIGFDLSGACVSNPHGPVLKSLQVECFAAQLAYTAVWVWLGNGEPDRSAIPDLGFIEHTLPTAESHGHDLIAASYLLCTDNILDLSHSDFLHPTSLGGGATTRAKSTVSRLAKSIRVEWLAKDDIPPPALVPALGNPDSRVDLHIRVEWHAPGVMPLVFGAVPIGMSDGGPLTKNVHIMTPQDDASTHYFFWNSRNFKMADAAFNEFIRGMLLEVFTKEDKRMLEAQQRRIGARSLDEKRPVLLRTDNASTQVRRIIDELIEIESLEEV